MSLRSEAVEAMTQALQTPRGLSVEAALDALLDFLVVHTEEWSAEYWDEFANATPGRKFNTAMHLKGLVAALRGTTE